MLFRHLCKRLPTPSAATLITSLALGICFIPWQASAKLTTPQETTAKLKVVQQEINELQFSLQSNQKKEHIFERNLRTIDLNISKTTKELANLNQKIAALNQQKQVQLNQRKKLEAALVIHRKNLAKQLAVQYTQGQDTKLKLLLSTEDMKTAQRMLTYLKYFHQARVEKIAAHQKTIKDLQALDISINEKTKALEKSIEQQSKAKAQYAQEKKERSLVLNQIRKTIKTTDSKLGTLKAEENRLLELFDKLKNALSDIPNTLNKAGDFAKNKGHLGWPAKGKVSVKFGSNRLGDSVKWNGIIIAAKEQDTVSAVHGGRIAYADWLRGFGLLTIVDHGDGYMTLYAHNQSLYKEVGDWVETGEVIARVGKTGSLDTAGLYFEIRHNGQPLNPSSWITRRWVAAK